MSIRIRRMANGDIVSDAMDRCGQHARIYLAQGDVRPVAIDLSDSLGSLDTISAATVVEGNASLTTPTILAGVINTTITGGSGANYADIQATLSTGEKITQRIIVIENTPNLHSRDYEG